MPGLNTVALPNSGIADQETEDGQGASGGVIAVGMLVMVSDASPTEPSLQAPEPEAEAVEASSS
jgi:hypothetical protein